MNDRCFTVVDSYAQKLIRRQAKNEMSLEDKYIDYLSSNGWKDKSGGTDYDNWHYIGGDNYHFMLTTVYKGDSIVIRKTYEEGKELEVFKTSKMPEIIMPKLLMWESIEYNEL